MDKVKMPEGLEYWTADEVAECIGYPSYLPVEYEWKKLYVKLWGFLESAENATPLGGDGSNGTVETPDGRLDLDNDDKAAHWWSKLTNVEANAIAQAYIKEAGEG
mgnify:CR=1 FL=1|tara:strand:- start:211 stop:525 length:315 start_codon:yes stop_codon:yes gene_type:complete